MNSKLKAALITASIFLGMFSFIVALVKYPQQLILFIAGVVLTLAVVAMYLMILGFIEAPKDEREYIRKK